MSWKKLLNIALVVLILMNGILCFLVINTFVLNSKYDNNTIQMMKNILESGDIILDNVSLPARNIKMPVYETQFDENEYIQALNVFTGKKVFYEGDNYVASAADGNYIIGKDFSFTFTSSRNVTDTEYRTQISDWSSIRKYFNLAKDFLNFSSLLSCSVNKTSEFRTSIEAGTLSRYGDGTYELIVEELIENKKTGNQVRLCFSGDTVIYAEGKLMFVLPDTAYDASIVEILNVLSSEKAYFDSVEHETLTIQDIEYGYELCVDIYGNGFLIPICTVTYISDITHVYDLVTGTMVD